MNKWEHFRYILESTLPSYKDFTRLSLECEIKDNGGLEYVWSLRIKNNSGLYEEMNSLSKFCGINWEHMFHTSFYNYGEMILEMTEINNEPMSPVYW